MRHYNFFAKQLIRLMNIYQVHTASVIEATIDSNWSFKETIMFIVIADI